MGNPLIARVNLSFPGESLPDEFGAFVSEIELGVDFCITSNEHSVIRFCSIMK